MGRKAHYGHDRTNMTISSTLLWLPANTCGRIVRIVCRDSRHGVDCIYRLYGILDGRRNITVGWDGY